MASNNDVNMQDAADDGIDPEPLMQAVDEAPAADNGDGMRHRDRNSPLGGSVLRLQQFNAVLLHLGVPMAITEEQVDSSEEQDDPLEGSYTVCNIFAQNFTHCLQYNFECIPNRSLDAVGHDRCSTQQRAQAIFPRVYYRRLPMVRLELLTHL